VHNDTLARERPVDHDVATSWRHSRHSGEKATRISPRTYCGMWTTRAAPPSARKGKSETTMTATQSHPDDGLEPAYAAPRNACDAHLHIFGPADKYPHVTTDLRYQPPAAPLAAYLAIARRLGFERFVFVQPSAYGLDNACMLDAMAEVDPAMRRGIVHLDETNARDADLARWHELGVRGVRINVSPIRKPEAGRAAAVRPHDVPP